MNIAEVLGLPQLLQVKKIVCVEPHPDDNEVGAAGTLRELALRGCEIVYITVTDGRAGGSSRVPQTADIVQIRKKERAEAGRIVGVSKQIALDFPDMGDYTEQDLLAKLIPIIREERPDMLLTVDPWMPYEAHPDHIKTGKAVAAAMLFSANTFLYPDANPYTVPQIAFYATAHPNTYIDVTPHWQRKIEAILAHESQFGDAQWPMLQMYLEYHASQLYATWKQATPGAEGYAEAFKVLTGQQLHFFPAALHS
ncbi:PIG-L deacetylase family protein [Paenibacillus aestuarii]|uniref:PIG-L deacetylase family protein n=1 Tax=Paenibacillus aestuarii TaxID=516965 RepID=A0ABW0KE52_9BACL|nr:PIG-L deacetylase family protein [Paenibacillus aestuarii]